MISSPYPDTYTVLLCLAWPPPPPPLIATSRDTDTDTEQIDSSESWPPKTIGGDWLATGSVACLWMVNKLGGNLCDWPVLCLCRDDEQTRPRDERRRQKPSAKSECLMIKRAPDQ